MLQCSFCGAGLRPTARICIKCGHAVTDEERISALQQSATSATTTTIPPNYSTNIGEAAPSASDGTVEDPLDGPIFSNPADQTIASVIGADSHESNADTMVSGLATQRKKLILVGFVVIFIAVVGYFISLKTVTEKNRLDSAAPVATPRAPVVRDEAKGETDPVARVQASPAPPISVPTEQVSSGKTDLKNIGAVVAPTQTSGLLTEMLQSSIDMVHLFELKSRIEQLYVKPEKGDVKSGRLLNQKGLIAFKQDDYAEAQSIFLEALKSNPADIEVLNNYAFALLKGGNYPASERVLGDVLSMAPGRTSGWANLADVYANTGRSDSATAAFVLGVQFATNKEKALAFLKDRAISDPNEDIRRAVTSALDQLSR